MATNPDFVRLSDRMVHGLVVDMETGWSISGFDVLPFPEVREQQRFVRRKINQGVLEPASQAEYDEVHPEDDEEGDDSQARQFVEAVKAASAKGGTQEHVLRQKTEQRQSAARNARLRAKLEEEGIDPDEFGNDPDFEYATDTVRRQRVIEEQKEAGFGDDDPEAQKERSATRPAKKAAATKKAGARRQKPEEEEE